MINNQNEKQKLNSLFVVVIALVAVICFLSAIPLSNLIKQNSNKKTPAVKFETATAGPEFFQVQANQVILTPNTPTILTTPTPTNLAPTSNPPKANSNIWKVVKIDKLAYTLRGLSYDLATFQNTTTQATLQAHCAEPLRPTPQIGQLYRKNAYGVLIPINEDKSNPLQRFDEIQ
jgi:hypothetical protein